jgi:hypothetical protein
MINIFLPDSKGNGIKPGTVHTDNTTGEILGNYLIEPDKNYWRNQTKEPGRWPGSS